MNFTRAVSVVGIGDDGCLGLSSRAANAVASAQILVGGKRHLDFFPQFPGEKISFKGGLEPVLDRVAELALENRVCILSSGDPLFYGIGNLVAKKIGPTHTEFIPHPSAMQWAFSKLGFSWEDADILSVHGRTREGFLTRLKRFSKVACFTDEENSPRQLAHHMIAHGEVSWDAWVCENLSGTEERIRQFTLDELATCEDIKPLNMLVLKRKDPNWKAPAALSYFPEEAFAKRMPKNGLITKKEVRCLSLAALQIRPSSVVWDIGAGSGSVSIEAALLAYEGSVFAIEVDPEGVNICEDNLRTFAVDNVRVVQGLAPEILVDLPSPDAVFVGGSKGNMEKIIETCLSRLNGGGRLVVNAITLDNVAEAYQTFRHFGILPEVTLLNVSRGEKLAHYLRYEALNPIHIFATTKPENFEPRGTQ